MAKQLERRNRVCSAPPDISPPRLLLLGPPEERTCADTPKTSKWLKDAGVSELGHILSQITHKGIVDAKERLSAGGGLA